MHRIIGIYGVTRVFIGVICIDWFISIDQDLRLFHDGEAKSDCHAQEIVSDNICFKWLRLLLS